MRVQNAGVTKMRDTTKDNVEKEAVAVVKPKEWLEETLTTLERYTAKDNVEKEAVEIVKPKEWLEEALITLDKVKAGARTTEEALTFNKFVFTHYVVEAFEAILAAKEITTEQAQLVHKVTSEYLAPELFGALGDYDQQVLERLLLPFVQTEAPSDFEDGEAETLVEPEKWMHEAIETLSRIQRSCKDPIQAAQLKHFVFATYVAEAFLAIVVRKEIFSTEVVLVNDIMTNYFDQAVYDLMDDQEKLILENLMAPFAGENGLNTETYQLVA